MPVLSNDINNRHEERIADLEEKNKAYDDRIQNLHIKIDDHKKQIEYDIKGISNSLDDIKKGQHSQELVNQKMNFTLDSINSEREAEKKEKQEQKKESKKDLKQMKYLSLGMIGTIITSLIVALARVWIGI